MLRPVAAEVVRIGGSHARRETVWRPSVDHYSPTTLPLVTEQDAALADMDCISALAPIIVVIQPPVATPSLPRFSQAGRGDKSRCPEARHAIGAVLPPPVRGCRSMHRAGAQPISSAAAG